MPTTVGLFRLHGWPFIPKTWVTLSTRTDCQEVLV